MNEITNIFFALSDKNRVRILMMLIKNPLCVCEITEVLELSPSTVSKHLSILKEANLLLDEKIGKWVFYSLNKISKNPKIQQIYLLLPMWLFDDEQIIQDQEKLIEVQKKYRECTKNI